METLMERAKKLQKEGIFLGGPVEWFEIAGRKLLITLINEGLNPSSKLLDIGCGCLRGGYWLIHFLNKSCYYGIEPQVDMLEAGIKHILEPEIATQKKPAFSNNTDFDLTVFHTTFDFIIARSIWSHTSKQQIQTMLDGFIRCTDNNSVFLTSYKNSNLMHKDYKGTTWVGKSHESDKGGTVHHSFAWIQTECAKRGLIAEELKEKVYNFGRQTWIKIKYKNT